MKDKKRIINNLRDFQRSFTINRLKTTLLLTCQPVHEVSLKSNETVFVCSFTAQISLLKVPINQT